MNRRKKRFYVRLAAVLVVLWAGCGSVPSFAKAPETLECSAEIDGSDRALAEYVQKHVPAGLTLTEGTYCVSDSLYKRDGEAAELEEAFETAVYTFSSEESEDVYTVISIACPENLWKKGRYELTLYIADTLWPYSPVEGILLARNSAEEEWEELREVVPTQMGFQTMLFSGKQMNAEEAYTRMIFGFPSMNNMRNAKDAPFYFLQNRVNEILFVPMWMMIGIGAFVLLAAGAAVWLNTGHKVRLGQRSARSAGC